MAKGKKKQEIIEKVEVAEPNKEYKIWYIFTFEGPAAVNLQAYANILDKEISGAASRCSVMVTAGGGEMIWDKEEV